MIEQTRKIAINFPDSLYDDAVSGMAFKAFCNKSFKPSAYDLSFDNIISKNDVWFVKRDFLMEFFSIIDYSFPSINIVTQHSDYEVDDALMSKKPKSVKFVFGSNTSSNRPDAIPIPLGLGPPYCPITPKAKDIKALDTRRNRNKLLYVNFRTSTYPSEREPLLDMMKSFSKVCGDVTIGNQSSDTTIIHGYLHEMIDHKFCLCPRGNGIDTHRLWESLYCRTIPVVRRENAHRNFQDLPILFVDSWEQVTESLLHNEYQRIVNTDWDYSKLSASWWGRKFRDNHGTNHT